MAYKSDMSDSLEQLLEALIRMVGRTNETVDNLQKRVCQLECLLKETHQYNRKEFVLTKNPEK